MPHAVGSDVIKQARLTGQYGKANNRRNWCAEVLDDKHGELKSMRTAPNYLRRGVASLILRHILQVAHDRCLHRLSLETGTQAGFTASHHLYLKHGFVDCEPFADYQFDPHSRFLSLTLCENNELP